MASTGLFAGALLVGAAPAQVQVGPHGVRSGSTVVDARGVHTATADIGEGGIATRPGARGDSIVRANGQTRSVDCDGHALTVEGNGNHLAVTRCTTVLVNGNGNDVAASFDRSGRVSVLGNRNSVHWRAAPAAHVGVTNLGSRNTVVER